MKFALFLSAVLCFGSFSWAMARLFTKPEGTTAFAKWLSLCAILCMLSQFATIVTSHSTPKEALCGLGLYCLAFLLFWSAVRATRTQPLSFAGSSDIPEHVLESGPYRWIRHPFYTSYLLAWIAGVVGTGQPWLLFTVILMGSFYWSAAQSEESKFTLSGMSESYRNYKARTGQFFPKIIRFS